MKLTREAFDEWRGSSTTEIIFSILAKHAERVKFNTSEALWLDATSEAQVYAARAEYKNMTQFIDLGFDDFNALTEDGADNE